MTKRQSKKAKRKAPTQAAKAGLPKKQSSTGTSKTIKQQPKQKKKKTVKATMQSKKPSTRGKKPKESSTKVLKLVNTSPSVMSSLRRSPRLKPICPVPPGLYSEIEKLWPENLKHLLETEKAVNIAHQYHESTIPDDGKVHTLVLGESHSRTDNWYLGLPIRPEYCHLIPEDLRRGGHINLVHCVSYGEWWLILDDEGRKQCSHPNTVLWWKLLATLSGVVDQPPGGPDPLEGDNKEVWENAFKGVIHSNGDVGSEGRMQQVMNKSQILEKLRQCGISIMDICPVAIFLASGSKEVISKKTGSVYRTPKQSLKGSVYKAIMKLCWNTYMLPLIMKLSPKQVIILGEKPADAIGRPTTVTCSNGQEVNIHYLIHPSSRTYNQSKYMPHLRKARAMTQEARDEKK